MWGDSEDGVYGYNFFAFVLKKKTDGRLQKSLRNKGWSENDGEILKSFFFVLFMPRISYWELITAVKQDY